MSEIMSLLQSPSPTNPPPSAVEERRNLILVLCVVLLALAGGWGLKWSVQNATHTVRLGGGIPDVAYPASWVTVPADDVLWQAINPRSASTFKSRVQISSRVLNPDESLDSLSVSWLLQRNSTLEKFRNLATSSNVRVGDEPAVLFTYAYVDDPELALGDPGLPVVVEAQDLLWLGGKPGQQQLLVITVAADAALWDVEAPALRRILDKLGMQEVAP